MKNRRHILIIQSFSYYQLKIFEALLKHNGAAFILESFALNLYISTTLVNI